MLNCCEFFYFIFQRNCSNTICFSSFFAVPKLISSLIKVIMIDLIERIRKMQIYCELFIINLKIAYK